MNQSVPQQQLQNGAQLPEQDDDAIDLASYLDLLFDHRWLISVIALATALAGAVYAFIDTPVYQANILGQA